MVTKIIITSIMIGILLPGFSLAQEQNQISSLESTEDAKIIGEKALEIGEKKLPGIIERIWKEEALPTWQKMWGWIKTHIWSRIENWVKPEIEKRKKFFEERFESEKKEMKEEIKTEVPKTGKSLWEKFKELID